MSTDLKICVNCVHYEQQGRWAKEATCTRDNTVVETVCLVSGRVISENTSMLNCMSERTFDDVNRGYCGPQGIYYVEKVVPAEEPEIEDDWQPVVKREVRTTYWPFKGMFFKNRR
jgi:hypothetical protein